MHRRPQFSLVTIFIVTGILGSSLGFWSWFNKILPGAMAAVCSVIWICGLAVIAYGMSIDVEDNWRRGLWQLIVVAAGCLMILLVLGATALVWLLFGLESIGMATNPKSPNG